MSKYSFILLADDDEGLRNTIRIRLEQIGYKVEVAATGLHALQKIKAHPTLDLVISDIKMPGMSGLKFAHKIKEEIPGFTKPIILISGHAGADEIKEAKKAGVFAVLVKPFKMEDLVRKIEECLSAQNQNQS